MADLDAARADADAAGRREAAANRELEGAQEDLRAAKKRGERAERAAEDAARAAAGAFEGLASASPAAVYAGQVAQAREAARVKAETEAKEDDGGVFGKVVHGASTSVASCRSSASRPTTQTPESNVLEGDEVNAALSAASAIPIAGYGATAIKAGRYADEAIEGADTATDAYRAATPGGAVKSEGSTASVMHCHLTAQIWVVTGESSTIVMVGRPPDAVEQQAQKRYPDLFDADELQSLENPRGIPNADGRP